MHISNISFDTPYAAHELAHFSLIHQQQAYPLTLEEGEDGSLIFLGRPLTPEVFPVYIPHQSVPFGKQFPINGWCLFRAPETGGKWVFPSRFRKLTLTHLGERIDVLFFREEEPFVRWVCFSTTDDPNVEKPGDNPLSWKEEGGGVTVLGASLYRERLHIPAQINGLPVLRVELPHYRFSENLRELVVEEGVEQIAVDLFSPHLQVISIPDRVQLLSPPNGIQKTPWFQSQEDGPVYFHRYFCGVKGDLDTDTLVLREDTVGIVEGTRGSEKLKHLVIPPSVCCVGMGAFADSTALELITLPQAARPLLEHLWLLPGVHFRNLVDNKNLSLREKD